MSGGGHSQVHGTVGVSGARYLRTLRRMRKGGRIETGRGKTGLVCVFVELKVFSEGGGAGGADCRGRDTRHEDSESYSGARC